MRGKINDLEEITVLDTVTDTDTYNYTFEAFFEEDFSRCDREERKENQRERESFRVSHFDCYSESMISDRIFMVVFS
jgi:hypothetical protein